MRSFSPNLPQGTRDFLITTFLTSAPFEREPGFRFFLSYQVFESLIQELFSKLIQKFMANTNGLSSTDIKDLIDDLSRSLQERTRLNEVIASCPGIQEEVKNLEIACNTLLQLSGSAVQDSAPKALYAVRNLLFHRYAQATSLRVELERVADSLFSLGCELAIQYVPPA